MVASATGTAKAQAAVQQHHYTFAGRGCADYVYTIAIAKYNGRPTCYYTAYGDEQGPSQPDDSSQKQGISERSIILINNHHSGERFLHISTESHCSPSRQLVTFPVSICQSIE
eukprot:6188372-Pleurochrysis_carterae.AAC.4